MRWLETISKINPFNTVDKKLKTPFPPSSHTFSFMTLDSSIQAKVKAFSITNQTVKYGESDFTSTTTLISINKMK